MDGGKQEKILSTAAEAGETLESDGRGKGLDLREGDGMREMAREDGGGL